MSDNRLMMEPSKEFVFNYKGFYFAVTTTPEYVASLENFEIKDSDIFIATYPKSGKNLLASAWFDHVSGWYSHAKEFNILFLTYEEMKKDLRSTVLKICNFIGKKLSEEEIESVVRQATFENMQKDPRANYENMPDDIMIKGKGRFLRKGKTEAVLPAATPT
ncbi:amine sulfotransferase-like [Phasianus colchicus]|uniref:amine sulfotransferase-like n=1 Tax=Phasianus colchicus TaxID=9054 RepID=UPI00129E190C|nr:amine sulfotransferase-like [Phasianus colchicus]